MDWIIQNKEMFIRCYRRIVTVVACIVLTSIVGTGLLATVYSIPVNNIEKNIKISAEQIRREGVYPRLAKSCTSTLDNFTDALMLLKAADYADKGLGKHVMNVQSGYIHKNNPYSTLVKHYCEGKKYDGYGGYARYWHGYLIVLKPLLNYFTYGSIRVLNGIFQVFVLSLLCYLLCLRGKGKYAFVCIAVYLMLMPLALAHSLQFSTCYYLYSFGAISILLLNDTNREKYCWAVFLFLGMLTSYFDFLTYPIATFGIPAIFYFLMDSNDSIQHLFIRMVEISVFWIVGYVGMWSMKWLFGSLILDYNVLSNAFSAIAFRTSNGYNGAHYGTFDCILKNIRAFFSTPFSLFIPVIVAYVLFELRRHSLQIQWSHLVKKILPFVVIAFAPIVWYAFATNHSTIHAWFTNKGLSVTVFAIGFICLQLLDCCEVKEQTF